MKLSRIISAIGATALLSISTAAKADDDSLWGCEVLLCLSNPSGPMAVNECVPPIKKLFRALSKTPPDPFPSCSMAKGPNGEKNYATVDYRDVYDECPAGMKPLDRFRKAMKSTPEEYKRLLVDARMHNSIGAIVPIGRFQNQSYVTGIGDAQTYDSSQADYFPEKQCVANYVGSVSMAFDWDGETYEPVELYEKITTITAVPSQYSIKVFIDGKLYRKIRPGL